MVFSSPVFLFAFLPFTLLIYFLLPRILKNPFLFLASIIFYIWGEVNLFYLMLFSITVNYFLARALYIISSRFSKYLLILALILNLLPLLYFKYFNFIKNSLGFEYDDSIVLPLGISFYTFHALSYIIDVYRDKTIPQRSFINLGLYITNFPQLVAGPIVRYPEISNQLSEHTATIEGFAYGIKRFVIGLSKKVLIANTLAPIADQVFGLNVENISTEAAWIGIICYSLQIYFDFSGYSDMAIGLGKMFGFSFPENFNYPYTAKSIKEFWRRWHISLSNWFRDYVYVPLGGNRKGRTRTYVNLILIFFLCGLWHGAGWNFIVWGLWHGCFLVFERFSFGKFIAQLPIFFQHSYTLLVVIIAWIFFRADNLSFGMNYVEILFGIKNLHVQYSLNHFPDTDILLAIIAGVIFSTPIIQSTICSFKETNKKNYKRFEYLKFVGIFILFIISIMSLASGTYNPFIYFRF